MMRMGTPSEVLLTALQCFDTNCRAWATSGCFQTVPHLSEWMAKNCEGLEMPNRIKHHSLPLSPTCCSAQPHFLWSVGVSLLSSSHHCPVFLDNFKICINLSRWAFPYLSLKWGKKKFFLKSCCGHVPLMWKHTIKPNEEGAAVSPASQLLKTWKEFLSRGA